MSRGRKPAPSTEIVPLEVDREVIAAEAAARDDLRAIQNAVSLAQIAFSQRIGERIGRRRAAAAMAKLVTVTDLVELQAIRDSKGYQGLSFLGDDGKPVTVTNWAEFCLHVEGRSREAVDLDLANLRAFGEEMLESFQRLGLGYREMRTLRALPADAHTALLEAARKGDKSELIDLAEALIERHTKEKATLERKVTSLTEDVQAKQDYIAKQAQREERLLAQKKWKPGPDSVARSEAEQALYEEVNEAFNALWHAMQRMGVVVSSAQANPGASEPLRNHATHCMAHLVSELRRVIDHHELDIAAADEELAIGPPAWMKGVPGLKTKAHKATEEA